MHTRPSSLLRINPPPSKKFCIKPWSLLFNSRALITCHDYSCINTLSYRFEWYRGWRTWWSWVGLERRWKLVSELRLLKKKGIWWVHTLLYHVTVFSIILHIILVTVCNQMFLLEGMCVNNTLCVTFNHIFLCIQKWWWLSWGLFVRVVELTDIKLCK